MMRKELKNQVPFERGELAVIEQRLIDIGDFRAAFALELYRRSLNDTHIGGR